MALTAGTNEVLYWIAGPSHLSYIKEYGLCILGGLICVSLMSLVPFLGFLGMLGFAYKAFEKYWEIKTSHYLLSHERLRIVKGGIRNRRTFDIERECLMEIELHEPFLYQLLGLGILKINDYNIRKYQEKTILLNGIENPRMVREIMRGLATGSDNVQTYLCRDLSQLDTAEQMKLLQ